jgi:hypothetical protein
MRKVLVAILLLVFAPNTIAAAGDISALLGLVPGERAPFVIKPFSPGTPFGVLRLPTPSPRLAQIFFDLEFMVLNESGRVVGVGAKRAFPGKQQCDDAQRTVRTLLAQAFGAKYPGPDPRWQYQSDDGAITAGAYCSFSDGTPYPVLQMDITHTKTNDDVLKHFRKVPANPAVERTR